MNEEGSKLTESLTVLMPVRDAESKVQLALKDLCGAMLVDDELLVINDGSADDTAAALHQVASGDERIRIITTAGVGLVDALNLGIREASHGWIARADADDRYPLTRLNLQRSATTSDVALVSGDYRLCLADGADTYLPCALGHPFVALSLINPQRIPHPGVLFRRDAVLEAGGYVTDDFPAEDLGLWIRMSHGGRFVGVPGCVVDWSLTRGSVTHTRQAEQRRRTDKLLKSYRPAFLDDVNESTIGSELARYANSSYSAERALLLLRDLRSWRSRGEDLRGQRLVIRELMGRPIASLTAGLRLRRDARTRGRWRQANSFASQ